ncbi:MAG TPA: YncE family protein, partial [Balneolaceae bacterium]|nr:YncE family protein [Balneolaceae bacterium]
MNKLLPVVIYLLTSIVIFAACKTFQKSSVESTARLGHRKVGPQPDSSILVPSNQLLRPAGEQVYLPGRPVDLTLTPDGKRLLIKNQHSLDLIRIRDRKVLQSLPYPAKGASYTGILQSSNGKKVFVSDAGRHVEVASIGKNHVMHWSRSIPLPKPRVGGAPLPTGMALTNDNHHLLVTLNRNNSLAVISLKDSSKIEQIPVGIAPYSVLSVSPDKAYVSNFGGRHPQPGDSTYNSSGSQVVVNPETGVASSGTISVVNLTQGKTVKNIAVGLHPSELALSPGRNTLYVACANSDKVFSINTKTDEVMDSITVHTNRDMPFGSAPNALTVSPDGKYLYVADGTKNAISVINTSSRQTMGFIPTGWYPGAVQLSKKGKKLYVANVKGMGSRNKKTGRGGYNSHDNLGSISIIPVPDKKTLAKMTKTVQENNAHARMLTELKKENHKSGQKERVPAPWRPNQTSYFKHVIYIIKENRTYDQVLGDMPQGNGDSSLVEFGKNITPNHHKLARRFALMDNYNCSGILSADGHQWTDEAYVTDYLEKTFGSFTRSYPFNGGDALAYAPTGFIWGDALRHGLTVRDYGEFASTKINTNTKATYKKLYNDYKQGKLRHEIQAKANIDQLKPYLSPHYPSFNLDIPDQYRASEFIRELK